MQKHGVFSRAGIVYHSHGEISSEGPLFFISRLWKQEGGSSRHPMTECYVKPSPEEPGWGYRCFLPTQKMLDGVICLL